MFECCVKSACEEGKDACASVPFQPRWSSSWLTGSTVSLHPLTAAISPAAFATFRLQLPQHLNVFWNRDAAHFKRFFQLVSTAGPAANTSVPLPFDDGVGKLVY